MIGCLVWGRVRSKIRIRFRVRVTINIIYHWSSCRRSKMLYIPLKACKQMSGNCANYMFCFRNMTGECHAWIWRDIYRHDCLKNAHEAYLCNNLTNAHHFRRCCRRMTWSLTRCTATTPSEWLRPLLCPTSTATLNPLSRPTETWTKPTRSRESGSCNSKRTQKNLW